MARRSRKKSPSIGRSSLWDRGAGHGASAAAHPVTLLIVLVVVGIVIGTYLGRTQVKGREGVVLTPVRAALFPLQLSAARAQQTLQGAWDALFSGRRLQTENARLKAEVDRLRQENEGLQQKAAEADRLRVTLRFLEGQKKPPLIAPVIGWMPSQNFESVIIGKGSRDGITPRTVVRTPAGLVGQVAEAGLLSSQVMLLTDTESGVGAVVRRNGKPQGVGIVQGAGRGEQLNLVYLKREADVKPGDLVVSSGLGGVIPPDIPIGRIVTVSEDKPRFLKSARIEPAAPPAGDLREVLLLR